jgi:hypothetical protein
MTICSGDNPLRSSPEESLSDSAALALVLLSLLSPLLDFLFFAFLFSFLFLFFFDGSPLPLPRSLLLSLALLLLLLLELLLLRLLVRLCLRASRLLFRDLLLFFGLCSVLKNQQLCYCLLYRFVLWQCSGSEINNFVLIISDPCPDPVPHNVSQKFRIGQSGF